MKDLMLLHGPGDELAPKDTVPSECALCEAPLVCSRDKSPLLSFFFSICLPCAKKGPEQVDKELREQYPWEFADGSEQRAAGRDQVIEPVTPVSNTKHADVVAKFPPRNSKKGIRRRRRPPSADGSV